MERVSIIVAECGAQWEGWARKLRSTGDRTVVLMQGPDESPADFARRAIERLGTLRVEGVALEGAAYITGGCADRATLRQRSKVTRKLSAQLASGGGATRLYLDPSTPPDSAAPTWIRALAMTLRDMARGSGLSVTVGHEAAGAAV